MFIIDLNQVMISNLMMVLGNQNSSTDIDEDLIRHFVLNSIRAFNMKFRQKYGELVIACDDTNNWRKDIYPYYKANRKKARDESALDWTAVFSCLNKIRDELKEVFPYRVIQVPRAEADDVIAALAKRFHREQPILIVSADKDFKQLQVYDGVEQYDPIKKTMLVEPDPVRFLKEHIIRGDRGDGVPNVLSPDDCLVLGVRQKSVMQKNLDRWVYQEPEEFLDSTTMNYWNRNRSVIDLSTMPDYIYDGVMKEYEAQGGKTRSKMFDYFIKNRLKNLLSEISDF